jgi:hypothetical protein
LSRKRSSFIFHGDRDAFYGSKFWQRIPAKAGAQKRDGVFQGSHRCKAAGGTQIGFHKNLPLALAGRADAGAGNGRSRRHIHELAEDAVDLRPRDGKPVEDAHSDGLAIPTGAQELQFAIATPRGPRVFMLFSQTK